MNITKGEMDKIINIKNENSETNETNETNETRENENSYQDLDYVFLAGPYNYYIDHEVHNGFNRRKMDGGFTICRFCDLADLIFRYENSNLFPCYLWKVTISENNKPILEQGKQFLTVDELFLSNPIELWKNKSICKRLLHQDSELLKNIINPDNDIYMAALNPTGESILFTNKTQNIIWSRNACGGRPSPQAIKHKTTNHGYCFRFMYPHMRTDELRIAALKCDIKAFQFFDFETGDQSNKVCTWALNKDPSVIHDIHPKAINKTLALKAAKDKYAYDTLRKKIPKLMRQHTEIKHECIKHAMSMRQLKNIPLWTQGDKIAAIENHVYGLTLVNDPTYEMVLLAATKHGFENVKAFIKNLFWKHQIKLEMCDNNDKIIGCTIS